MSNQVLIFDRKRADGNTRVLSHDYLCISRIKVVRILITVMQIHTNSMLTIGIRFLIIGGSKTCPHLTVLKDKFELIFTLIGAR